MKSLKKKLRLLTGVFVFTIFIAGCGGGGGSNKGEEENIGAQGGVVEVIDPESRIYGAKITIPPGAIDSPIKFKITKGEVVASAPDDFSAGEYVNFEGFEGEFNKPVELAIPYRDDDNDGYIDLIDGEKHPVEELSIYTFSPQTKTWDKKQITKVDLNNKLLFIKTEHLSQYTASPYDFSHLAWPTYTTDKTFIYDDIPEKIVWKMKSAGKLLVRGCVSRWNYLDLEFRAQLYMERN